MRHVLTCPINPPSSKMTSHRGAQAAIYASMIAEEHGNCDVNWGGKLDLNDYDVMWVYHGNDFSGSINMFGGMQGFSHANNVLNFSNFKGIVGSLGIDMPDYGTDLETRRERCKHTVKPEFNELNIANMQNWAGRKATKHPAKHTKMVVGDSHAIAMYRPGVMVNSVPFTTLNGALNRGLQSYVDMPEEYGDTPVNEVEFYFGNIDVRHHLCRISDSPKELATNTRDLANRYVDQVQNLPYLTSIYELMPIENESRGIPLTGQYMGKNFHGSWQERNDTRELFNSIIKESGMLIEWSDYLKNDKGELCFSHMEKPRSVHLSRASYPYWSE